MSILIKGIDLPIFCENCFAYHSDESGYKGCFITMHIDTRDECQSIQTLCPLIEIPTPHGRLIDADEMQDKAYERYFNNTISSYGLFEVNRAIEDAPTILEAEE